MKDIMILMMLLYIITASIWGQTNTSEKRNSNEVTKSSYNVNQAFEIESLVPMFFTGGYHLCIGYRYEKVRIRVSVINGGTYDAEPAGLKNSSSDFKRYYRTSPGVFLGYNVWENLEVYSYLELHTFAIEEKKTGVQKDLKSAD
jgi:hypothetical protein